VVQVALAAIVLALVLRKLAEEWGAVKLALDQARPNWLALAVSGLIVLATYAILIETWRVLLRGWQHDIPFVDAARIWTISNLGKYLPGKVWSITALVVMTREYGVSATEGATASVLVTLVNTIVGFVVAIVAGASLLRLPPYVVVVIAMIAAAVLASPSALPRLGALAGRVLRRDIVLRPLAHRVLLDRRAAHGAGVAHVRRGVLAVHHWRARERAWRPARLRGSFRGLVPAGLRRDIFASGRRCARGRDGDRTPAGRVRRRPRVSARGRIAALAHRARSTSSAHLSGLRPASPAVH